MCLLLTLQISCASSSSELADRTKFRAYFQMLPTEIDLAAGYAAIARQYGWRHMTIVQQQENLFSRVSRQQVSTLLPVINFYFVSKHVPTAHTHTHTHTHTQTVDRLNELFEEDNINSSVKVFESEQEVTSIQDQLFVSDNKFLPWLLGSYFLCPHVYMQRELVVWWEVLCPFVECCMLSWMQIYNNSQKAFF